MSNINIAHEHIQQYLHKTIHTSNIQPTQTNTYINEHIKQHSHDTRAHTAILTQNNTYKQQFTIRKTTTLR